MRLLSLVALLILLSACGTKIPENTPCLIDGDEKVLYCAPPKGAAVRTQTIEESNKYICWSPRDVESIFNYIRRLESRQK